MEEKKACFNCVFNRYDRELSRYYCSCEESEQYEDTTEYNDTCDEWFAR